MTWDDFVYWFITIVVIAMIGWLLFAAAPGHEPLITLVHSR